MRIDHTNCTHPRTPKGRAQCRNGQTTVTAPELGLDTPTAKRVTAYARKHHTDPASIAQATVEIRQEFKMPKLTCAQLASPIFQSMLKK
jgi:hypothetical protein